MKKSIINILLLFAIAFIFILEIGFGNAGNAWQELGLFFEGKLDEQNQWYTILLHLRIPRALTALFVGSSLALGGLLMQTLFRNPLAGPSILGVSSGASLGVALFTLATGSYVFSGLGERTVIFVSALAGSLVVLFIILGIAKYVKHTVTLLIVGLMISYITSAIVSVLQYQASESSLKAFVVWGMGSFANTDWNILWFLIGVLLISIILVLSIFKHLNILLLGENYAQSMGVNYNRVKLIIIIVSGLVVSVSTAFCGPIAFLGLAVPHLARSIHNTSDHRLILPTTILLGGALGLLADLVSRMPWTTGGLPLNTVMAMIGAPIVIVYILKNSRRGVL